MMPQRSFNWRSEQSILLFILLLAAVLRLARLDTLPPSIFRDEAEKAYNAYSILQTGRDVEGQLLPAFVRVFGVTTSAAYQYVAIPFIALLGLNEWSARLPAAFIGIATVLMTYLFAREMRGRRTAAWAALLLALSPWHIVFSRWAQQGIFLPLLFCTAAYMLIRYVRRIAPAQAPSESTETAAPLRTRDCIGLILGAFLLGHTTYVYDVARLFTPLLLFAAMSCFWRELIRRPGFLMMAVIACLLGASPAIYLMLADRDAAQARFAFVSILQPGTTALQAAGAFLSNYMAHWSPHFLLLRGDAELRHGAGIGVLTLVEFLGLLAGVVVHLRERRRENWFLVAWLLLFPVAASLTRVGIPHALRTIVALPAIQVVAAIGLEACTQHIREGRRKTFQQMVILLAFLAFVPFGLRYFSHQHRVYSAFSWQYGVKQALRLCNEGEFRGTRVYLHNVVGAEYLVPFYLKTDPRVVQSQWGNPPQQLDRYTYMPFQPEGRTLQVINRSPAVYITPPGNYIWPNDWRPLGFFPVEDERHPQCFTCI